MSPAWRQPGRIAGNPARPAGGDRLRARGRPADHCQKPQHRPGRGARRRQLLSRLPHHPAACCGGEALPGGGVPGHGRRAPGRHRRGGTRGRGRSGGGAGLLPWPLRPGAGGAGERPAGGASDRRAPAGIGAGGAVVSVRVYVPQDAAARAVGADAVASAIAAHAAAQGEAVTIVRNGSRGLLWLEPLVEVETAAGRIAYGPVAAEDVADLFDAGFLNGGAHALCRGETAAIPYLAGQTRLTFARLGLADPLDLAA
ncbi:MAG: hypothetical protein KDC18_12740, partial [Alphaproteobacteria bacterium]|nr:hypothetical protein [Alphaproteobacteria bacterium]